MSLLNRNENQEPVTESVDYVSEDAISQIITAMLLENASEEEIDEIITEAASSGIEIVTERSIVKLDKKARMQHAYKIGILQCAKEDENKLYKKLMTLWKLEAVLFKKLEKKYRTKAIARSKEAVRRLSMTGKPTSAKVATRTSAAMKPMIVRKPA